MVCVGWSVPFCYILRPPARARSVESLAPMQRAERESRVYLLYILRVNPTTFLYRNRKKKKKKKNGLIGNVCVCCRPFGGAIFKPPTAPTISKRKKKKKKK